MSTTQERRAPSASRVSLETLVEICGNEPGIPAFEAETVDVSARGMHLRTAYLPENGAPLVCRFESGSKEIVVEGVVAWRKESARGGEFGVRFTALDSRSVDALRGLVAQNLKQDEAAAVRGPGPRVRLHIDGLGAPMKARVRGGGAQKLEVGSSLEFLKVGRKLEIEDLEAGARRTALIDGVDVVIDPSTQVPQLVVALRYEGAEEDTPQPSVMHLDEKPEAPGHLHLTPSALSTSAKQAEPEPEPSDELPPARAELNEPELDDEIGPESPQVGLGKVAGAATEVAGAAGGALKRAGAGAWRGMGRLLSGASGKIAALRASNASKAPKRTTAAPPGGPVSIEGKRVRQQQPSASSEAPSRGGALASLRNLPAKKKMAVGAGASVVIATALALALKPSAEPPGAAVAGEPATVSVQGGPSAAPVAAAAPSNPPAEPAPTAGGVSANVPLFGPTPMATLEPAPLGPAPEEEVEELAEAKASARAADQADNEEFAEEPARLKSKTSASSKKTLKDQKDEPAPSKRPEDVASWGRGKLHLPTIHRLRLDGPGGEIRGANEPTGFTVLIPERKIMEKGAGIAKRDSRIARIRTTNTPGGGQLRIEFKDGTPAYRVRLRKDYIELLLSASDEKKKP